MTLVDTSVWIDFLRGSETAGVARLKTLLAEKAPVAVCPPVLQEILQGAVNIDQFDKFVRYFRAVSCLVAAEPISIAIKAARVFQQCRERGLSIRSSNDALIACLAIEHRATLLHNDRDFEHVAAVVPGFDQTRAEF